VVITVLLARLGRDGPLGKFHEQADVFLGGRQILGRRLIVAEVTVDLFQEF
jgi:hypothetical protein